MAAINKVIVVGNLGRDPEVSTVKERLRAQFTIATNSRWTDQNGERHEQVEWHNITAWGRMAELAQQYLKKGSLVYVEGRLQTDAWEANKDGVQHACGRKHYKTHIVVASLQFLDRRDSSLDPLLEEAGPEPLEAPPGTVVATEDLPF
jgi:single-strand DNA-binding protein